VGNPPVSVTVVVLRDEDFGVRVTQPEGNDVMDGLGKEPAVNHANIGIQVDPGID
jgi:hypothetical protein